MSCDRFDRRAFVRTAALATMNLGMLGRKLKAQENDPLPPLEVDVHAPAMEISPLGMPGLFPGRVVEVFDPRSVVDHRVSQSAVARMVEQGMKELTGESSPVDAWARFIEPRDVVAVKVNPSGTPLTVSSVQLVREVIDGILSVGVKPSDIIVYDRSAAQLQVAGYPALVQPGVHVTGFDNRWFCAPAAVPEPTTRNGFDPTVYCEMNCFGERETRSYLANLVSRQATKIINIPCLKEHNASGVTGCLKNLGYGSFNNVARTHVPPHSYTDPVIPTLCAAAPLRSKAVLHIMDGLRGVWHSGPFAWNRDFVYEPKTIYFGTDPVAVDRIELETIEKKRLEMGAPSLWDRNPQNLGTTSEMSRTPHKNRYYREPRHIRTAGEMGLGIWDLERIDRRRLPL
ncbi:MAG: DUF362 domain-containing protein [Acidobacteriota bacterium]